MPGPGAPPGSFSADYRLSGPPPGFGLKPALLKPPLLIKLTTASQNPFIKPETLGSGTAREGFESENKGRKSGRVPASDPCLTLRLLPVRSLDHADFPTPGFCPQAGQALPFPIDEKEAKILSKRTLTRAF